MLPSRLSFQGARFEAGTASVIARASVVASIALRSLAAASTATTTATTATAGPKRGRHMDRSGSMPAATTATSAAEAHRDRFNAAVILIPAKWNLVRLATADTRCASLATQPLDHIRV